jgi:hypothetical protein
VRNAQHTHAHLKQQLCLLRLQQLLHRHACGGSLVRDAPQLQQRCVVCCYRCQVDHGAQAKLHGGVCRVVVAAVARSSCKGEREVLPTQRSGAAHHLLWLRLLLVLAWPPSSSSR